MSVSGRSAAVSRQRGVVPLALLLGALALLLAIYVRLWFSLLDLPRLGGVDFISFYTAGRIARAGAYQQLYDLDAQHAIQVPIVGPTFVPGGTLLFLRLPLLAPLLGLISSDSYVYAYISWAIILLGVLALCGVVIYALLRSQGWLRWDGLLIAVSGILFYPAFLSLLVGQDTIFLLLAVLVWMWALLTGRDWLAGLALACTIMKPQFALALGLPLLVARRPAGKWLVFGGALLLLYSLVLVRWQGMLSFVSLISLSSQGEGYGSNHAAMYNVIGLIRRAFPTLDSLVVRAVGWLAFLGGIAGICWLWWNKRERLNIQDIGLAVVVSLITSPHLYVHDLSLLLLPLLSLIVLLRTYRPWGRHVALLVLPASSFMLFAGTLVSVSVRFALGYLLMVGLIAGLGLSLRKVARPPAISALHD